MKLLASIWDLVVLTVMKFRNHTLRYARNKLYRSKEYIWCICLRIMCSIRVLGMWNLTFRLFRTRSVQTSSEKRKTLHNGGWWLGMNDCSKTGDYYARGIVTVVQNIINPLNTKRRLLYLKTQFVPRSKHFSSRL